MKLKLNNPARYLLCLLAQPILFLVGLGIIINYGWTMLHEKF